MASSTHVTGMPPVSKGGNCTPAAGILALGLLMLLAAVDHLSLDWQISIAHTFRAQILSNLKQGTVVGLLWALLSLALFIKWQLLKGLLLVGAFFAAELWLRARPASWSTLLRGLWLRALTILIVAPVLARTIPSAICSPLVSFGKADLPVPALAADLVLGIAALLIADTCGYWAHRAQHMFPILWRFHAVHHSIEDMNAINSNSHPFDAVSERLAVIVVGALIGLHADAIVLLAAFMMLHDHLAHTSAPINLGSLNAVISDNRTHFVHHGILPEHHNKNFAPFFTHWDRLCGTYCRPNPETLAQTGLSDKHAPRSLREFFTGSLRERLTPEHASEPRYKHAPGSDRI